MRIVIKILISLVIILGATEIGNKFPSISGLIGVMPITGVLVFVWVYREIRANQAS